MKFSQAILPIFMLGAVASPVPGMILQSFLTAGVFLFANGLV